MLRNFKTLLPLMLLLLPVILAGCGHETVEKDSLHSCGDYEVYADSIVSGSKIYKALSPTEIANAWRLPDSCRSVAPAYSSSQPMADALFTKAVSEKPRFTPLEIYLSLALLKPEESMAALREAATAPVADNEDFPSSTAIPYWGLAAWEVYCTTGSKAWLKEAYDLLNKMLTRQWRLNSTAERPFMCGMPRNVTDPRSFYPAWMDEMARFQSMATSVNIDRANSLAIASRMAATLRLYAERELEGQAAKLRNAINDRLWFPDAQRYSQYLYCHYYPIVSPVTDNEANALAILSGIATPEMSAAIIASLPYAPEGVPALSPALNPSAPLSPEVQALTAIAAAKVRNPLAFTLSTASLWNLAVTAPQPALWPAVVTKGIFGISLSPDRMAFSPMVPASLPGEKHLDGLRYRNATLDIAIHGTGDRVASFTLDSVSMTDHSVTPDLSGYHKIVITLSGNDLHSKPLKVTPQETVPPIPSVKWTSPCDFTITSFDKQQRYGIYVNGVMDEEISTDTYSLRPGKTAVTAIVPSLGPGRAGYTPAPHVYAPASDLITIPASSITPRRPPRHFIKDPATATNYIELAARHNTRITCYANVPAEGDYFITIGYSNGSDRCAMRTLDVNDRYAATLLFPPRNALDWITVFPSTTAVVHLDEGVNKLSLTYIQGTLLFNKLTLLKRS